MLGPSKLDSIATFATPEVVLPLGLPILPGGIGYLHPHRTLLAWQCAMTGFEFLKAKIAYTP